MKKKLSNITNTGAVEQTAPTTLTKENIKNNQHSLNLDYLRTTEIMFATPCYGGQLADLHYMSMIKTVNILKEHGISYRIHTIRNESLVTRARNNLVAMFLQSNATHLFFIDADIEFQPEDVLKIINHNREVVVGAYPKKALPINYAVNFKYTDLQTRSVNVENGLVELLDASTGFFCIKREVFDQMIAEYPELQYRNDSNIGKDLEKYCYAFFDCGLDETRNRYLSEDYYFCRLWQKLGGKIWLDPLIKLNHVGSYVFEGDISKIINDNITVNKS